MEYAILLAVLLGCYLLGRNYEKVQLPRKPSSPPDGRGVLRNAAAGPCAEKRVEARQSGPFIAAAVYDPATRETVSASLYDSSRGGAGLLAEQWLPRGRELTLVVGDQRVKIRVRNCTRKQGQWVAGCEYTEPLPDALAHLLALGRA
jgi:hypothetical protein